jgi:hypothetical protein
MQLTEHKAHTICRYTWQGSAANEFLPHPRADEAIGWNRLGVVAGLGLMVTTGPAVLNAIAQTTLVSVRILLEVGHFALVAFQVLGN